jgi:hypothetical protein
MSRIFLQKKEPPRKPIKEPPKPKPTPPVKEPPGDWPDGKPPPVKEPQ